MRWQVGNGNKIRVWHDKWVPRPSTYKVIAKENPQSSNALVCELINRATKEWNKDKLDSWFLPEDREAILSIPLSSSNTHDRLIWTGNRSGKFTIKSAYMLAVEEKLHDTKADCSDESVRRRIWKYMANEDPTKDKTFCLEGKLGYPSFKIKFSSTENYIGWYMWPLWTGAGNGMSLTVDL